MFINTKKCIKIVSDNGTIFEAKAGWIGEVPQWVAEHWYFKALCKDGTVTAIVRSGGTPGAAPAKTDGGGNPPDTEFDALRARAAELKIPNFDKLNKDKLTAAIAEAEAEAEADTDDLKELELASMDAPSLREYAAKNNIDLTGVADNATVDDLRQFVKNATEGK
jgi:hypothetical protein